MDIHAAGPAVRLPLAAYLGVAVLAGLGACVTPEPPQCGAIACAQAGRTCGSLVDACGQTVDCGGCTGSQHCDDGRCVCTPDAEAALCQAAGQTCGALSITDGCGTPRTIASCGECAAPQACGGGGVPGRCGCEAETDEQLCTASTFCGSPTVTDRCGQPRTPVCGRCLEPYHCGAGNHCGGGPPGTCSAAGWCWYHESPTPASVFAVPEMSAIWGTGPTDVWAVGAVGTLLHYDGTFFRQVAGAPNEYFNDVFGFGPRDVWFGASSGTVYHWDGSRFLIDSPTLDSVEGLWGTSASDLWAVGKGGRFHRSAAGWQAVPEADGGMGWYDAVHGTAADDVWVADTHDLLHWDGRAWTRLSGKPTSGIDQVFAVSPGEAWTVGDEGAVQHWTDAGTQLINIGAPTSGLEGYLNAVWVSNGEVFVGAGNGHVWQKSAGGWARIDLPGDSFVSDFWGTSTDLWATGGWGGVWRRK